MTSNALPGARCAASFCLSVLILAFSWAPAGAAGEYVLDLRGKVERLGDSESPVHGDGSVQYWVYFQYRDPAIAGLSSWDRLAQTEDGRFEVQGIRAGKVYRVSIQKITIDPSLAGGRSREEVPLDLPDDFWTSVPVGAEGHATEPIAIDLVVMAPGASNGPPRSLSLQFNGKELRLSAFTPVPEAGADVGSTVR